MSIKYDYTQAFKLVDNVPNLSQTFKGLHSIRTKKFLLSSKITYVFTFASFSFFFMTYMNFSVLNKGQDHQIDFKIVPDFITGKKVVTYRFSDKRHEV